LFGSNQVACLMLGSMTLELHRQSENYSPYKMLQELKSMFEKQAGVERFDLIQTFHACKQEERKPVATYVLQMKGYVDQLERLGYMLPQDLIKSNKKSLKAKGKGKVNEKGKDKQVYIPKPKNPKLAAKEHPAKDDTCHHCKEGFREEKKLKQGALYLYVGNGVRVQLEAIRSCDLVLPNGLVIYLDNCHYAPSITRGVVLVYRLKRIEKLQQEGLLNSTDDESFDQCVSCLSGKMTRKLSPHRLERATDLLGIIHTDLTHPYTIQHNGVSERRNRTLLDMVRSMMNLTTQPLSFWDYALDSETRILNMVPTKKVDKTPYEIWYEKVPNLSYLKVWGCEALVKRDTPDKLQQRSVKCIFIGYPKETMGYYFYFPPENEIVVARYAEFFEKNLITQEVSGRAIDLEEIQDEDTSPPEITSEILMEVKGFEPPQEEVIPIRRSERTHRAPNRLCLNVKVNEHSLWDLNEPASYIATMLDLESNKWIDAMNAKIQSMINNMVWILVDLPTNCKTVRSKWIFKKKTDMNGEAAFILGIKIYRDSGLEQLQAKCNVCLEAKYIAALKAAMEVVWIRKFISGLGIVQTINEHIRMFYDNPAALHFANEPGVQRGARHYHRRYHYVCESIALGEIRFLKVLTYDNMADPFTKGLFNTKLTQHTKSMGLRLASSFIINQMCVVGNKMHKAFPLPGESSHWQYKFPLPVEGVPTARSIEIPLPGVCTAMMKKLPVKENWQLH
nr:retrotransposon protein, putative, Ty1-copia subclass [Tanacetum cinerariifolium]